MREMNRLIMEKRTTILLIFAAILCTMCGSANAGSLTSSDSPSIGRGITITHQNWQRYRQFMSEGLIALFEGNQFWHLPKDVQIEVGPTTPIPLPKRYLRDTEQYSHRVTLVRTGAGGYVPHGYVAGLPFPNPFEGDPQLRGQRIFWNAYYRYQPRVQSAPGFSYTLDRFGNMTRTTAVRAVNSQLDYLSEPDLPHTISDAVPYYYARFEEQLAPEQGKYSAILDLTPSDPTRLDEVYEYVPTLRRSLRLSQAARCAPVFGSDYLIDDENGGPPGLPQLFQITYLGDKKILALEHATPESFDSPATPTQLDARYYYPGSVGVVPFPRPAMGKWEIRDTYVLSLKRLPQFAKGYCYSERVIYVDKENYFGAGELDLYQTPGKLFKTQLAFLYPVPLPASDGDVVELLAGPYTGLLVNFRNKHVTISPYLRSCLDGECASDGYLDINRYASPEGLMKIIQ
ncbi:MAG TPA: DUF1329 domain-containing protein [Candidatus Binataceae bacterium]|nr:DUF1329 domain-containing protein [Candidatus Binataceae bacterium]